MKFFGMGMMIFGLYGTIVLHSGEIPSHNGFMYLLGPWIFPSLVAACYAAMPFRPYRGIVYTEKTRDVDTNDPIVMRLVALFKSKEALGHLWIQTLQFSAIIFFVMGILAIIMRKSLTWGPAWNDLGGSALALTGSFLALTADYIDWCLMTWAEREDHAG